MSISGTQYVQAMTNQTPKFSNDVRKRKKRKKPYAGQNPKRPKH